MASRELKTVEYRQIGSSEQLAKPCTKANEDWKKQ